MGAIIREMRLVKDLSAVERLPSRDGYGHGLVRLGGLNENVVALCCDLTDSTRVAWFREKYPERFVEVGVAEQNMMGLAAGMSFAGKIPFVSSYAVFSPGRNWDQLRVSVCYSMANVKIEGAHAGISVGPDGATHQALEDIAITRCLPNLTVVVPADAVQAEKATVAAGLMQGPVYIRFGREKVPVVTTSETPFAVGKANTYREGRDVAVIACGIMVYEALLAAEELARDGVDALVMDCHTVKPVDAPALIGAARRTGAVVTAEEHQVHGGLGSAVAEVLSQHFPVPVKMVGVMDRFGESGSPEQLLTAFGCTKDDIVRAAHAACKMKGR